MLKTSPIKEKYTNRKIKNPSDNVTVTKKLYLDEKDVVSYTVHATDEKAIPLFENLPQELLPTLPIGHQWAVDKKGGKPGILKSNQSKDHEFDLLLYGPDNGKINYNFLVDGKTIQSFAHTKKANGIKRYFPMSSKDYTVNKFDYKDSKTHIRGHCIDHQDTMLTGPKEFYSTYDPNNYIPEPQYKYWGLIMRRLITADIRKSKNGYMQYVHYGENPHQTNDGTYVPEYGYFYEVNIDKNKAYNERYFLKNVYNFDWNTNYAAEKKATRVLDFVSNYETETCCSPVVKLYDASASDRSIRLEVRNMDKKANDILSGKLNSFDKNKDAFFAKNQCADREFESVNKKLNAYMHAELLGEKKVSIQLIKRAEKQAIELIRLDDKKLDIIDDGILDAIKKLDSPSDDIIDSLVKSCKDQGKY